MIKPNLLPVILLFSVLIVMPLLESYAVTYLIKINEVEFNPRGPVDDSQWVEIYNSGDGLFDLGGWLIKGATSGRTIPIADGFVIEANNYLIVPLPSVSLDIENESVVLLNPDSVEADRTPLLSDTADDDQTWQRFPNGIDSDRPIDWSFRNSTFSATNGFPVVKPKFTLSDPIFIDDHGNKVSAFVAGQMAGVKSEIINKFDDEQTFAYIIQIKDEEGFPVFISWIEDITVLPSRAIKPAVFWLVEIRGEFQVQVFVWRSLNNPEPLTPIKVGLLRVAG
ncbi:MAG: lamin tail domain-containing protein [Nitrososphaerales archaeon]